MNGNAIQNTMKTFKRILLIIGVVLVLGFAGWATFAIMWPYSEGSRAGTVVKFSKKGYVFKTHEGQLKVGGMAQDDGGDISPLWDFSVDRGDDEIQAALEEAMESGSRVKVHYQEKLYQFDWRGDTRYFIDEVELVEE